MQGAATPRTAPGTRKTRRRLTAAPSHGSRPDGIRRTVGRSARADLTYDPGVFPAGLPVADPITLADQADGRHVGAQPRANRSFRTGERPIDPARPTRARVQDGAVHGDRGSKNDAKRIASRRANQNGIEDVPLLPLTGYARVIRTDPDPADRRAEIAPRPQAAIRQDVRRVLPWPAPQGRPWQISIVRLTGRCRRRRRRCQPPRRWRRRCPRLHPGRPM